jgi:uncharacterized protein with HEPN domain
MLIKDRHCLEAINEAANKIFDYSSEFSSADEFLEDVKSFDAVMMNFVIIGEMVDKISGDLKKRNNQITWSKIKGFRNLVAHDYFGIDAEEVWQIIQEKLPTLKSQLEDIINQENS